MRGSGVGIAVEFAPSQASFPFVGMIKGPVNVEYGNPWWRHDRAAWGSRTWHGCPRSSSESSSTFAVHPMSRSFFCLDPRRKCSQPFMPTQSIRTAAAEVVSYTVQTYDELGAIALSLRMPPVARAKSIYGHWPDLAIHDCVFRTPTRSIYEQSAWK